MLDCGDVLTVAEPRCAISAKQVSGCEYRTASALFLAGQALPEEACQRKQDRINEVPLAQGRDATGIFEYFERLPPELMLTVMKCTTLSKGQKDLVSLIVCSRAAYDLWEVSGRAILRFRAEQFPEHEDFELDFHPRVDIQVTVMPIEEGTTPVAPRLVRKSILEDVALHFESRTNHAARSLPDYDVTLWKGRSNAKRCLSLGFPYLDLLETLTEEVDMDLETLRSIEGSQLLWAHDEVFLRRAILLLIQMGVPTLLKPVHEHEHDPHCDCPLLTWMWKEFTLLASRCDEVQDALRDILVFLTSVIKRKLKLFTCISAIIDDLSVDWTTEESTDMITAVTGWTHDRIRLLIASLIVRNGIWGLLHPTSEFMTSREFLAEVSLDFTEHLAYGSFLLAAGEPDDSLRNMTIFGQSNLWETLGLCYGTELWHSFQYGTGDK